MRLGAEQMTEIQREFYRNARGPAPTDEDSWCLVFDGESKRVFVRHEWQSSRHSGVEDLELDEFLKQAGAAPAALIEMLFPVRVAA
jgi:hypothetical protein